MSFFIKKGTKRKRGPNSSSSPFSSSASKKVAKKTMEEDEDEILSDDSEVEGRPDVGYESDEDDGVNGETAEEKRIRLAETYIQEIIKEEKSRGLENGDQGGDLEELINKRLKKDDDEEKGKLRLEVADSLREVDPSIDIQTLRDHKNHKLSITVVLLHENSLMFTASKDGGLTKWDYLQGTRLIRIKSGRKGQEETHRGHCSSINALAITTDGKFLASGDNSKLIHVWKVETMELIKTFKGHRDAISGLAFRINTHTLYSCSADRSVKIWSVDELAYVETLFGHQDKITGIDAGRRERAVTSGGRDGSVRLWKIVEESQLVFNGPSTSTDSIKLINDENFVTCGEDGHLSLWGVMKKKPLFTVKAAHGKDPINDDPHWLSAVTSYPSSDLIASGSRDGYVRLWKCTNNFRGLKEIQKIPVAGFVNSLSFNKDGTALAVGIGQEHRLGRWWRIKEAKNSIQIIHLKRLNDEEDSSKDDEEEMDEC